MVLRRLSCHSYNHDLSKKAGRKRCLGKDSLGSKDPVWSGVESMRKLVVHLLKLAFVVMWKIRPHEGNGNPEGKNLGGFF